ncbi:hypothetical protein LCGC14_2007720 [marine sediment metagenome]|uniref:Uncharacterized protein n=1 Tax=marine sediment metagenome TaxID=412755 RepID=A0A0F9HYA8_9ZZZZ
MRRLSQTRYREQSQDAVIHDAAVAEDFETVVMNELRLAIRKEMKSIL